jgi:hypothetical protein
VMFGLDIHLSDETVDKIIAAARAGAKTL